MRETEHEKSQIRNDCCKKNPQKIQTNFQMVVVV